MAVKITLVLKELEDSRRQMIALGDEVKSIRVQDIPRLQIEIATLKVKSGLWGAAAGIIPAILALVYVWMGKKP